MRTIITETQVFKFDELDAESKRKALDKLRDNREFDKDHIIEDAKDIASLMGINAKNIYFTGFSSQGDGACFEGTFEYKADCLEKVKDYAPIDSKLHDIALLFSLCKGVSAKIKHVGHYYHSNSMDIEVGYDDDSDKVKETEILVDAIKALANWIYRQLEKEYDYQISDEYLIESIKANEYEFTASGKLV
jgi:hypothetical protein